MASTRAAWPRSVHSKHDVLDSNPRPARPAPSSASLVIAIYRGHLEAALHGRGPCLQNVVSRIEIRGLARPALCGRAAWPLTVPQTGSGRTKRSRFVPFGWVSWIKIRGSPSSAVHAHSRPALLHLFYSTPSCPLIFPKPS
ncbi:hypothetical protein Bca4012_049115 [Brassica carinata]